MATNGKKILIVGGGGREHALAWKLAGERGRPRVFCAPGNAGTAGLGSTVAVAAADLDGLAAWAGRNRPDLTVVGPEAALCAGLVDRFEKESLRVFGPSKAAAQLEGSKSFAKSVMEAAGVPTAKAACFRDAAEARRCVRSHPLPLVIKADGLAGGKGVILCSTRQEAEEAIDRILVHKAFGAANQSLLVEEFLEGEEASVLALVDGKTAVMLSSAQDHKRIFDGDRGPNTGGMGAYSPAPIVTPKLWPILREQVFERTLSELHRRGIPYKGVLYAGLMITAAGPKVLEFNCRFGDPETQAILPRLAVDLSPALEACVDGTLKDDMIRWREEDCICIVMASGGYPARYETGLAIEGLDEAASARDVLVFHAGTRREDGRILTDGGRVLGVTALGFGLAEAAAKGYKAVSLIRYKDAHYRKDIGARGLNKGMVNG